MLAAVSKLAIAGERAGFTVEEMIRLLNAGLSIESLLEIIAKCLDRPQPAIPASSSRWIT
jgi:hypothetical protein